MSTVTLMTKSCFARVSMGCCITLLVGCGGGSDGNNALEGAADVENTITLGQAPTPDEGEVGVVGPLASPSQPVPDDLAGLDRVSLVIDSGSRCAVVGEPLNVGVTRALTDEEIAVGNPATAPDVTSYVSYSQSLGDSLSQVSVADSAASFAFDQQDIVSLTVELDNGSVTAYLAGFAADTPTPAILRKPAPGGCLYALRLSGYCATGYAKGGTLSFARDGQSISAQGCELDNPGNLPVFELEPAVPAVQQ